MANQILFGGFQRLRNFALDPSSIHRTLEDLQAYLNNPIAHEGQQIVVFGEPEHNGLYLLVKNEEGNLTTLKIPDVTITNNLAERIAEIKDLFDELDKTIKEDILIFKNNTSDTLADFGTRISDAESAVSEMQTALETKADDSDIEALDGRIDDLETSIGNGYDELKDYVDEEFAKFVTSEELEEIFNQFNENDKENILELLDAVKEIKKWRDEHDGTFDALLTASQTFKDTVKALETADGTLRSGITTLSGNYETLKATVDGLVEKKNEFEGRISSLETFKNSVPDTYVTKETYTEEITEINTKLNSLIGFENVEQTAFFDFGTDKENKLSKNLKNCRITEVRLLVENPASEETELSVDLTYSAETNKTIKIIPEDEIDISEEDDYLEYIYSVNYFIPNEVNTITVNCSDFKGSYGKVFVKYFFVS